MNGGGSSHGTTAAEVVTGSYRAISKDLGNGDAVTINNEAEDSGEV